MPDHTQSEEITADHPALDAGSTFPDNALPDCSMLDNPIWNALSTRHLGLAVGDGRARRYPAEIGPLSGIPSQSEESYAALGELARAGGPNGGIVGLFSLEEFRIPAGLKLLRGGELYQMVRQIRGELPPTQLGKEAEPGAVLRKLTAEDAPAMVELARLTEPGPFALRTIELGNFYGVFHGSQLAAMCGKRMHWPGFTEVSALCTRPEARGRGYARMLMSIAIGEIEAAGETAMLHVYTANPAVRMYEALGFAIRRKLYFAVLASAD